MTPAQRAFNERKKAERHARGLKVGRSRTLEDRLAEFSTLDPDSGCRIWTGATSRHGYGSLTWKMKRLTAHRAAYECAVGPIPTGMVICHRCDTPACINPAHLFLGTQRENLRDMVAKGRHPRIKNITEGDKAWTP